MPDRFKQRESGLFVYPGRGWRRLLMRLPLIFWRMGLEPLLRRSHFLVLTTRGCKSGAARHAMLEHTFHAGAIYVAPGWGERTQWYRNVLADPRVTVQRNGTTFAAVARNVTDPAELAPIYHLVRQSSPVWAQFLESWGVEDTLEDFLAKQDRLRTLRLDPIEGAPPLAPLVVDLWYLWLAVPALGFAIYLLVR